MVACRDLGVERCLPILDVPLEAFGRDGRSGDPEREDPACWTEEVMVNGDGVFSLGFEGRDKWKSMALECDGPANGRR